MSGIDPLTVKELINDRGQALSLLTKSAGTYNPATGGTTGATSTPQSVKGVFVAYRDGLFDGADILRGDRKLLLSAYKADGTALTSAPDVGDAVTGQADQVQVVTVETLKDAGVPIAYVCQVRE